MCSFHWNPNALNSESSSSGNQNTVNSGSRFSGASDRFLGNLGGSSGNWGNGSVLVSQSLLLDSQRNELVQASGTVGKKGGVSEAKTVAALKSHSEAERRRRERINAHLATLRGLVSGDDKMDKATVLAEVINQVKQLKKTAVEASQGLLIPIDADEVRVESLDEGKGDETFRATLCCDYQPELLSELRRALDTLRINIVKAEISTLGGRVKTVFEFTSGREKNSGDADAHKILVARVHQALSSILDKISALQEYSPRTTLVNRRRRVSYFDSASSSSRD